MGLFRQRETRSVSYQDVFGKGLDWTGRRTFAGESVTADSALRVGAFWSAANLLTNIVADLPVDVFRGRGGSRVEVLPQPTIVSSPSLLVSRREWTAQAMMSLLLRGNAYGYVLDVDSQQRPVTVEWAHPDQVTVYQKSSFEPPVYEIGGQEVRPDRMLHLRAFLVPGSAIGLSPVEYRKQGLGVQLAMEKYSAKWFGEGAHPSAIFQNTARTLDEIQASAIKERFLAAMRGKREPLTVGADWKYTPIQVSPNDSALLDSMGLSAAETCRIFGPGLAEILGYPTGEPQTYSNRVDRTLDMLTFTVGHWVLKLEDALNAVTARPQYVKYNVDALLRTDPMSRWRIHQIARQIGVESVDEIRDHEDMPPLPDGEGQDHTPLGSAAATTQTGDAANAG